MSGECKICGEHTLECKCFENGKTIEFVSLIVEFAKTNKMSVWSILHHTMSSFCFFCDKMEISNEKFNELIEMTKETYSRVNNGESKKIFK